MKKERHHPRRESNFRAMCPLESLAVSPVTPAVRSNKARAHFELQVRWAEGCSTVTIETPVAVGQTGMRVELL